MLKVENSQVYDLRESIMSVSNSFSTELPDYSDDQLFEKCLKIATKLAPMGGGHNNFLCGIRVSYDLIYPQYITPELQRYHFNDIVMSGSKMHKLAKLVDEDCFNVYVTDSTKALVNKCLAKYNSDPSFENYMTLLSNCPLGLELFERCTTNYLQLRTIYHQRKNHRLQQDWGPFCKWIESLPYAEELIMSVK